MPTRNVEFRPDRRRVPPLSDEQFTLEDPLIAEETVKLSIIVRLIPVGIAVLVVVMMVMMIMMGRRMMSPMMFMMPAMLIMGMFGMNLHGGGHGSSMSEVDIDRRNWLIKLRELRVLVQGAGRRIHTLMVTNFPNPHTLLSLTSYRSMWQVKKSQAYVEALAQSNFTEHPFLSARVGVGMVPLLPRINYSPQQVPENLEPVTASQFGRFLRTQQVVTRCPVGLRFDEERSYGFKGDVTSRLDLARSVIVSLAYNHSPNELVFGIICDPDDEDSRERWEWLKWLPHTQNVLVPNSEMPPPRFAWDSLERYAKDMVSDIAARNSQGDDYVGPRMLVFVDTPHHEVRWPVSIMGGVSGVGFVIVNYKEGGDHVNRYEEGRANLIRVESDGKLSIPGRPNMAVIDRLTVRRAENIARQFSRWRPTGFGNAASTAVSGEDVVEDIPTWFDVLNIHDIKNYDPRATWKANAHTETFRAPLGYKYDGKKRLPDLMYLDMVEMSRGGSGPHGCVQGKTGTGKSYLLNGFVLTLCTLYGPDKISFILADFKAGAAFDGYEKLPHVITVLTNLETQKEMVERAGDVIDGEIIRREEFLFKYKVKDILEYRKLRRDNPDLPPLPDLFLVADEFHEFMIGNRSYLRLFTRIGAKGRSLGMHVIPCSQFIDASLLSDLMNHLTFGISLASSSAQYSRTVLDGDPSAASLPMGRGHAMVRYVDRESQENRVETFVGFSIEDPYLSRHRTEEDKVAARRELEDSALPFGLFATEVERREKERKKTVDEEEGIEIVVSETPQKWALIEQLAKFQDVRSPNLWQPSLVIPMTLGEVPVETHLRLRELTGINLRLGDLDDPLHHARPPYILTPEANIAVCGRVKSGKSMTVMTMIANSALVYQNDVNWYIVDYMGGGLSAVENFPNVGGYCTKMDSDIIERFMGEFYNVLDYREKKMSEERVSRIEDYLEQKKARPDPRDPYGHMFLVLDGFNVMVLEDEDTWKYEPMRLLMNGGRYGLHVVVTVPDISSLPIKQQNQFSTVVALGVEDVSRMGSLDMTTKQKMKGIPSQAGRGVDVRTGLPSLVMIPRLEKVKPDIPGERGREDVYRYDHDYTDSIVALGERLRKSIPQAPRIAVVGDMVEYHAMWEPFALVPGMTDKSLPPKDRWLPFGVDTRTLIPTLLPKTSPHFLIAGDPQSGKTSTLRTLITSVVNQYTNEEAKFVIFDPNFSLLNEMERLEHTGYVKKQNYATNRDDTREPVEMLKKLLHRRSPTRDMDLDPRDILNRSWFTGPEIFVIIDGYQRIGSVPGTPSPIDELVPFLTTTPDLGVHLFVTSAANGLSMALGSNKMFKMFSDQTAPLLMLSGPTTEPRITSLKGRFEARRAGRGQLLLPAESRSSIVQIAWTSAGDAAHVA